MATSMPFHQRSPAAASAVEQSRARPMTALLERLGSAVDVPPWSAYLPEQLQRQGLRAPRATEVAREASLSLATPDLGQAADAPSKGSQQFCLQDPKIAGQVWSLSQEAHGCRQVQRAMECAPSDVSREALASELRGHVVEACKCPHANHVLQKLIVLLPSSSSQFVVDELMAEQVTQIARHKYGCRIIQRLVEQCHPSQVLQLVETLLTDIPLLSRHPYGTHVVQNILQHGSDEHRGRVMEAVVKNIRDLGSEARGCAVVSAALSHGPDSDRAALARILVHESGLLEFLASSRHGHVAALCTLELLVGDELKEARSSLRAEEETLRNSRYGVIVLDFLEATDSNPQLRGAACQTDA